ncbi:MAG: T9SS type A sorting domain-containing protein [Bacteroidota bacterium]|jgi:hypothetical protein
MKRLVTILISNIMLVSWLLCQNYQVTNVQEKESLGQPILDIQGSTARIIPNINFLFYTFPVTGPAAPIPTSSAVHPSSMNNVYLINTVMRGNGNMAIIAYINFESFSGNEGYRIEYVTSGDGGTTWSPYNILDKVTSGYSPISLYYDNVILEQSDNDYLYYFWRNQDDTNRIYMAKSVNGGASFGTKSLVPIGDISHPASGLSLKPLTISGTDNLFISYSTDTSLYFIRSSDGGVSFGSPKKILHVSVGGRISSTKLVGSSDGTMYLSYGFWIMHMGIFPGNDMINQGTILLKSTDYGGTWSTIDTLGATEYSIYDLHLTSTKTLVQTKYVSPNLYLSSSLDGKTWSDTTRVNPTLNTATGTLASSFGISSVLIDNSNIGIAWTDISTGYGEIFYRKMAIPTAPAVGVARINNSAPNQFALNQNYPNPFNPTTQISFSLTCQSIVSLKLFDVLGREVKTLASGEYHSGTHTVTLDASSLPSGVYFYRLQAGTFDAVRKLTLIK